MQLPKWKIKLRTSQTIFSRTCKGGSSSRTRIWEGEREGEGNRTERWDFRVGVRDVQKTM